MWRGVFTRVLVLQIVHNGIENFGEPFSVTTQFFQFRRRKIFRAIARRMTQWFQKSLGTDI
jgi:hypothetical protein